jgi:hypothetical protein
MYAADLVRLGHCFTWRAARSAITIVGAFVLPLIIVGMIDARPSDAP